LPLEDQLEGYDVEDDPEYNDSDSDSDSDVEGSFELVQLYRAIKAVLTDLYKVSFKIRNASTRLSSSRALLYKEVDPESGIDLFESYSTFDQIYVQEFLLSIRELRNATNAIPNLHLESLKPGLITSLQHSGISMDDIDTSHRLVKDKADSDDDYLIDRLARAITNRRRYFGYWRRHALKLAQEHEIPEPTVQKAMINEVDEPAGLSATLNPNFNLIDQSLPMIEAKLKPGQKTILSGTDATKFDPKLDDKLDAETVISYATTAKGTDGKAVAIPSPPLEASLMPEFNCPYCWITCPSKQGKGKAWRYV
jgi:hypothetical protein